MHHALPLQSQTGGEVTTKVTTVSVDLAKSCSRSAGNLFSRRTRTSRKTRSRRAVDPNREGCTQDIHFWILGLDHFRLRGAFGTTAISAAPSSFTADVKRRYRVSNESDYTNSRMSPASATRIERIRTMAGSSTASSA